jgi:hypothetical protein
VFQEIEQYAKTVKGKVGSWEEAEKRKAEQIRIQKQAEEDERARKEVEKQEAIARAAREKEEAARRAEEDARRAAAAEKDAAKRKELEAEAERQRKVAAAAAAKAEDREERAAQVVAPVIHVAAPTSGVGFQTRLTVTKCDLLAMGVPREVAGYFKVECHPDGRFKQAVLSAEKLCQAKTANSLLEIKGVSWERRRV